MDMKNLEETWSIISPGLLGKEEGRLMDVGEMGSQALLLSSLPRKATGLQSCVCYMEAEGTIGNVSKSSVDQGDLDMCNDERPVS